MDATDFQKIITNAIDSEVESYTFYKSVADRAKDANLKTIFLDLAEEEKGHREYLQALLLRESQVSADDGVIQHTAGAVP